MPDWLAAELGQVPAKERLPRQNEAREDGCQRTAENQRSVSAKQIILNWIIFLCIIKIKKIEFSGIVELVSYIGAAGHMPSEHAGFTFAFYILCARLYLLLYI